MTKTAKTDSPLYGFIELSAVTGMSTSTLSTLLHRSRRNREKNKSTSNDIPEPDTYFGLSPVWTEDTVRTWLVKRATGTGAMRVKRAVDPEQSLARGSAVPLREKKSSVPDAKKDPAKTVSKVTKKAPAKYADAPTAKDSSKRPAKGDVSSVGKARSLATRLRAAGKGKASSKKR
jgi:hypothetical protein